MALLRPYDRMIAGMSRRQLLNAAAMLGIGSLAAPLFSRSLLAKPVFRAYPFTLGVASGDPLPDGVVLWTRLAPDPLNGGGMPGQPVEVNWEVSATTSFANPLQKGTYLARPELNHSVHIEAAACSRGATISTASSAATRSARSAALKRHRQLARRSTRSSSASSAAITMRADSSPPIAASPSRTTTSSSTPATTSTRAATTAIARRMRWCGGTMARRSSPSSTTATATPSTKWTRT